MAEQFPVEFDDKTAMTMLLTCALDLLAQTEAQHRAILSAHARLEGCVAHWETGPPTLAGRKKDLCAIAHMVGEVLTAIRSQRLVAVDMQQTVSALQSREKR
jgi:hypothetical protein